MSDTIAMTREGASAAPPALDSFAHVSLPCRDIAEGKAFYVDLLGGRLRVDQPTFCSIMLAGADIGIGSEGVTFVGPGAEYPHIAFFCGPETMARMKPYLAAHGIPSSNYWTRQRLSRRRQIAQGTAARPRRGGGYRHPPLRHVEAPGEVGLDLPRRLDGVPHARGRVGQVEMRHAHVA